MLLALVVTLPMPLHLGERIIANEPGEVDGYLGIWNIWWAAQALQRWQDPYFTPLLFWPQGLDLFWQTLSLPQGLLALPFTLTLGPLPAYNLLILLSFVLGGYFAFLFIRYALRGQGTGDGGQGGGQEGEWGREIPAPHASRLTPHDLGALIGGAVYAFAPFHMQKVLDAQLEVASVQWLPLWALATLVLLERRRWPWAILSGLLLLWVGLGTWYYGLFALMASAVMAGLWAIRECRMQGSGHFHIPHSAFRIDLRSLLWGLAPIGIWFVIMGPRLLSLAQTGDTLLGDARVEQQDAIADLISFWLPNPNHPLWGQAVTNAYTAMHPNEILWNVAFGLVGTALALVGVAAAWRSQWRWLALGAFAAAMALGAEIVVAGWHTGVPGPYALIRDLPGVRSSHRPNHFVLISILTTALFAGAGATVLLGRATRAAPPLAAALLAAIVAIDGWAGGAPLFQRPVPQPYLSMPAPDGAILPVPLHLNFSNSENLWYQTFHRWPIVGGFIGREPPYPLARYAPGIKELRYGRVERDDILSPGWPELARETLAAHKIRYVMFHHEAMGSPLPLMREIVGAMGLTASYEDALITVHPVPEPPAVRPLAYLGAGWGDLEDAGGRRWRWMGERAEVVLLNPTGAPRAVSIDLDLEAFERARTLTMRLDDGPPFTLEVSRARMRRTLRLVLPAGESVLYLVAPADHPPGQPERRLSLAVMGIAIR
jgi:hypothetical protein